MTFDDARIAVEMTVEELAAQMNEQFAGLKKSMDQGFNDSKVRDDELRDLMTFGLEAREVLRDEMHRRFDAADRKHDQQITLLKDAVQHLNSER